MKKGQSISYKDAMEILQQMFTAFDAETIKSVLYMNGGKLEQTIESLLMLCDENSSAQANDQAIGNNNFEDPQQQGPNDEFIDPQVLQEREDLKLARQLQQQFDREAQNQPDFVQQQQQMFQQMQNQQYQQQRPSQKSDKKRKEQEKRERERKEKERKQNSKQKKVAQSVISYEEHQFAGDDNDFKINKGTSELKQKKTFSQKVKDMKHNFFSLFHKKKKQQPQNGQQQNQQIVEDDNIGIELLDLNEQQLNFSDEETFQEKHQQYKSQENEEKKMQMPVRKEKPNMDLDKFDVDDEEEQGAQKNKIYATDYKQSNKQGMLLNKQGDNSDDDLNLKL